MLDYEMFKKILVEGIKEYLPSVYSDFSVCVEAVPKINGMREAMIVFFEAGDCRMTGPNIYLDDLYDNFAEYGDIRRIQRETAEHIMAFTGTQYVGDSSGFSLDGNMNHIIPMLVNTEMNKELLETVPHREFLDLSVIYRLAVPDAAGTGYATTLITEDMREELGLTVEELDILADENSRRDFRTQVFRMTSELSMMTTDGKLFGAVNLLRTDEIKKLAGVMDSNLYVLPSSIHDLMVLRDSGMNSEGSMFSILKDGNENCNSRDENLSYNIYYYDRNENLLEMRCPE